MQRTLGNCNGDVSGGSADRPEDNCHSRPAAHTTYLTDHVEQMSIPGVGDVAVTVKNALKGGEAVILVQKRGAQQYLVIDRY